MQRVPVQFGDLTHAERAELRRHRFDEHIAAGLFQFDHLQVGGRVGRFVAERLNNQLVGLVAEHVLQARQIVSAEIVVLVKMQTFAASPFCSRIYLPYIWPSTR